MLHGAEQLIGSSTTRWAVMQHRHWIRQHPSSLAQSGMNYLWQLPVNSDRKMQVSKTQSSDITPTDGNQSATLHVNTTRQIRTALET